MKKSFLLALILLLSVSLFGCIKANESDEATVASLVEDFGGKLQTVSLQAPRDIVNKSMQENYGDFVSPALLAEWQKDLQNVPGRVLSSPWPDRIEILSIEKLWESAYEVKGEIIEMTSVELASGGVAAKRPITLVVGKIENRWLITAVKLGAYEETNATVYTNIQYGFSFSLPESWQGYSIITDTWEGLVIAGSQDETAVETGPLISIRHPQWAAQNPRQDIPIMIFTLTQWDSLQQGEFHIGAAPIGPSELGRNSRYVFALPARYNYAFPTGFEEVENILQSSPLKANENYTAELTMDRQQLLADLTSDGKEEIILGPPSSLPPEALNEKLGGPLTVYSADDQVLLDKERGIISVVGTYDVGAEHPVLIAMLWGGGSMGMYYGAYLYDADTGQLKQLEWNNFEFAVGELVDDKPESIVIWNRGLNPEGGYEPFYQRWVFEDGQMMPIEKWAAQ